MKDGFRTRMSILHTWAGLILSGLLFAIFWTGTLSVFDKEIDRWMMPHTRIHMDTARPLSVDREIIPLLVERAEGAKAWTIVLPAERRPFLTLAYDSAKSHIAQRNSFHPITLEPLPAPNTRGASNFIYPFHHNLTLRQNNIGALLVGIASMGMLCLLISGIVIHRRIFADFFTLRLLRGFGRANLDIHNLTGVVLLPFTIVITLSGLMIAHLIYFPKAPDAVFAQLNPPSVTQERPKSKVREASRKREQDVSSENEDEITDAREGSRNSPARSRFIAESQGRVRPQAIGQPANVAAIDPMIAATESELGQGAVYMIRVSNPGDAGGVVALRLNGDNSVSQNIDNRRFSTATGEELAHFNSSSTTNVFNFIAGMHYIKFKHWPLRWLYFIAGLGACALIATGLLHWTQARNQRQGSTGFNVSFMNAHNIAAITGIISATGAFLVVNRLLNNREQFAGISSRDLEVYAFFGVWLACLLHALIRVFLNKQHGYRKAWAEQCWAIALIAIAAVGLNWITTGDHLLKTLFTHTYWPVATLDLVLVTSAVMAIYAARKLSVIRES